MSSSRSGPASSSLENDQASKMYKCDIGGEWKPLSAFSANQQKRAGKKIRNPANSGMICREHKGEPVMELRCEGPCALVLPLQSFSKRSRSTRTYICIACQGWISSLEPDEIPSAAPNHEMDRWEQSQAVGMPMVPEAFLPLDDESERLYAASNTAGDDSELQENFGRLTVKGKSTQSANSRKFPKKSESRMKKSVQYGQRQLIDDKSQTGSLISFETEDAMIDHRPKLSVALASASGGQNQRKMYTDFYDDSSDEDEHLMKSAIADAKKAAGRSVRQPDEMSEVAPNIWYNAGLTETAVPQGVAAGQSSRQENSGSQLKTTQTIDGQATRAPQTENIPPTHHRRDIKEHTNDAYNENNSISTATTLRMARNAQSGKTMEFNGWDERGLAHRLVKAQTDYSSTTGEYDGQEWREIRAPDVGSAQRSGFQRMHGPEGHTGLLDVENDNQQAAHAGTFNEGWSSDDEI